MPHFIPYALQDGKSSAGSPLVRLMLRGPDGAEKTLEFRQETILIGSIPGCDLLLPGQDLPPVVALAVVEPMCLRLRQLQAILPCLVNEASADGVALHPRDVLTCGPYQLRLDLLAATTLSSARRRAAAEEADPQRDELAALKAHLERDRREWEADAERQAEALAVKVRETQEKEKQLQLERAELDRLRQSISQPPLPPDLEVVRGELQQIRDSLYHQYRKRRDSVVAMREAVRRAAFKVQEEKRQLAQQTVEQTQERQKLDARAAELISQQNEVAQQFKLLEEWQLELDQEQRLAADKAARLENDTAELQARTKELHEDLVRMQRWQESLQLRQEGLDGREAQAKQQEARLQEETPKLEARREELELSWRQIRQHEQILAERESQWAEKSECLREEQDQLDEAKNQVEASQQRLEAWERQLGQDRLRLDRLEAELEQRRQQVDAQQQRWRDEESAVRREQAALLEEVARLRAEADRFGQLQAQRDAIEEDLAARQAALEEGQAEAKQRDALLQEKTQRLLKLRLRIRRQRQTLGEKLQLVSQSESAHESLQEQLRRRIVVLSQREAQQQGLESSYQARLAQVAADAAELEGQKQAWQTAQQQERQALDSRRAALDEQAIQLQKDRESLAHLQHTLIEGRQELAEQRRLAAAELQQTEEQNKALLESKTKLAESLPGLLRAAETALERLVSARSQLRTQLQEIHAFRQRCRQELETRRRDTAQIVQQLDERHQVLLRLQDEQRLEAAALRQDCLAWQGQIEALQSAWNQGQLHLAEQADRIAAQARDLAENSTRLETQAVELQDRERDVAYRRSEVNRHLSDMQDWYKHKLRDMAEKKLPQPSRGSDDEVYDPPQILPLKSTRNGTDGHLADLLSGMGLIDAVTLQALLAEAHQQRLSLRESLLRNEFLTAYQMELIEEGRVEALVLGPLRVIDRIRIGTMETTYRVFDPRLGDEALLRHLSNTVDRKWQAEYRSMFHQSAQIHHANVASTLEVLEMSGSPAVLQEWLVGLPGTEWQNLISEPSVALRLMLQAAEGLQAIHQVGLIHGQLHVGRLLLTPQGELKICGAGEPRWLNGLASTEELTVRDDLADLARLVLPWCRSKARSAGAGAMTDLVKPLEAGEMDSAEQLRAAVYAVLRSLQPDEAAWQRLLAFIHDRLSSADPSTSQKKSA